MNILYYDTSCTLCGTFASWVVKYGRKGIFQLEDIREVNPGPDQSVDHVVVKKSNGSVLIKAEAMRYVLKNMQFPFQLFGILISAFPLYIQNQLYDHIARNRYRYFGRKKSCAIK